MYVAHWHSRRNRWLSRRVPARVPKARRRRGRLFPTVLEPLFFRMDTRDAGCLDHPHVMFFHVLVVIMAPSFKYAAGHLHKIMHPPDASRGSGADEGDLRQKDVMHRSHPNQRAGPCVDEEIATRDLRLPRLIFAETGSDLEERCKIVGQQLRQIVPSLRISEADVPRLQCLDLFDVLQMFASIHTGCSISAGRKGSAIEKIVDAAGKCGTVGSKESHQFRDFRGPARASERNATGASYDLMAGGLLLDGFALGNLHYPTVRRFGFDETGGDHVHPDTMRSGRLGQSLAVGRQGSLGGAIGQRSIGLRQTMPDRSDVNDDTGSALHHARHEGAIEAYRTQQIDLEDALPDFVR